MDSCIEISAVPLARRYRLPAGITLPAPGSVLPPNLLQVATLAEEILFAARREAESLLEQARREAVALRQGAEQQADTAVWQRAAPMLRELAQIRTTLLLQAETLLMDMACDALRRLLLDVPADWPPRSGINLLLRESGGMQGGDRIALRLHPDDLRALEATTLDELPIALTPDATIGRGQCVLVCAQGELRTDYAASIAAMVTALLPSCTPGMTSNP